MTDYTTKIPPEGAQIVAATLGLPAPPLGQPLLVPPGAGERAGVLVLVSANAGSETARECVRIARDPVLWLTHGAWVVQTCLGYATLQGAAVVALRHTLCSASK